MFSYRAYKWSCFSISNLIWKDLKKYRKLSKQLATGCFKQEPPKDYEIEYTFHPGILINPLQSHFIIGLVVENEDAKSPVDYVVLDFGKDITEQ